MLKLVGFKVLCCLLLIGSLAGSAWADAFGGGIYAYKNRNYSRAATLLQDAMKQNKPTPDALFYLGMAYTHLGQYDSARKAFETVIQMLPTNHALAAKARNNITYLTKQQIATVSNSGKAAQVMTASLSRTSKDNYLTHVIPSGKIVHFSASRMPLKVFVSDGLGVPGWNAGLKQSMQHAMQAWQTASRGKVRFSQTYSAANADIIVKWQKNFSHGVLGVSPLETVGDTIVRSDVNLAVYYPDSGVAIPLEDLKAIATHELGHAIGIRGHSPFSDDIMYFSKTRPQNTLSQRDINTVGMLYQLDADVQNNPTMSTAQTKKYFELYQLGVAAQSAKRPSEAMQYYRQAIRMNASMPEAKFNLGALLINESNKLIQANNLPLAKRQLEEATQLYTEILKYPQSPAGSQENLEAARNNLALVNQELQRR